ncbi:MAG: hypothetical protein R3C56_16860 [Pirellulaceae bacterium]
MTIGKWNVNSLVIDSIVNFNVFVLVAASTARSGIFQRAWIDDIDGQFLSNSPFEVAATNNLTELVLILKRVGHRRWNWTACSRLVYIPPDKPSTGSVSFTL